MAIPEFFTVLVDSFGLKTVVSIWLLLGGTLYLPVAYNIQEGDDAVALTFAVLMFIAPGVSLWILKLWFEYVPFPPRELFGVEVVDISGMGIFVLFVVTYGIVATEELTGEAE